MIIFRFDINMEVVTKQKCNEQLYFLRRKNGERDAWFYLLVLYDKISVIKDFEEGKNVNVKNYYRYIEYREKGVVKRASDYGTKVSGKIAEFIDENYGKDFFCCYILLLLYKFHSCNKEPS